MENNTMFGWTCPRCNTVYSPMVTQCGCPAPSYTLTSSTQIIGTFCNKCQNIVCRCHKNKEIKFQTLETFWQEEFEKIVKAWFDKETPNYEDAMHLIISKRKFAEQLKKQLFHEPT